MSDVVIKDIGTYLYADEQGYVHNDAAKERTQPSWFSIADQAASGIENILKEKLVSVYLRGSVATSTAVDFISDIDLFVITHTTISQHEKEHIERYCGRLLSEAQFITRFDIGYYTRDELLTKKERVLVKLRSILLFGEDLSIHIDPIKVGFETAVTIRGLNQEIDEVLTELEKGLYTSANVSATIKWMAKRVVRSGLELVSTRKRVYTRDLYKCYEAFCEYYPDKDEYLRQSLLLALNPSNSCDDLYFLCEIGKEILTMVKRDTDILK